MWQTARVQVRPDGNFLLPRDVGTRGQFYESCNQGVDLRIVRGGFRAGILRGGGDRKKASPWEFYIDKQKERSFRSNRTNLRSTTMQFGLNGTLKMAASCQRMSHFGLSKAMTLQPVGGIVLNLGHKVILRSAI